MNLTGHFLESSAGKVFLTITGSLPSAKVILCLPPLFEEMNLSRAVMARQAQCFAAQGFTTCILDYYGTGDSEGDVNDGSAELWLEDVIASAHWLQQQGAEQFVLWGVRFGGLLQMHYQRRLHDALPVCGQLLWKPITSGKRYVSQLLRLKQAATLVRGATDRTDWRDRIAGGDIVEVAGYPLNERLLASIESLHVPGNTKPESRTFWLELGAAEVQPATLRLMEQWPDAQCRVQAVPSPVFWQIPETFTVPHIYPYGLALVSD